MPDNALPPLIPREVLFGNPERASAQLSPDGTRLTWLAPLDGVLNVWLADAAGAGARPVTRDADRGVRFYTWAHDNRHILYLQDVGGDENWRLHQVDPESGVDDDLTPYPDVQVQLLAHDRRRPHELLVAMNQEDARLHDVYHLDLRTHALTLVVKNPGDVSGWVADRDLVVRGAEARRIWNGMFDIRPAMIARCTGASDVVQAVSFAREHRLLTSVRGGGHSFSGKSTCNGGIVIDLQLMQGVRVDPRARRAWLESGSRLGQLDRETQALGLATRAGTVADTGAAGLTLGGGLGRLGCRFGLTCDNLVGADVVTADGKFVHASESDNADLLWGLRGGGGNFGVVTNLEYRLHPVDPTVLAGHVNWPIDPWRRGARAAARSWPACTRARIARCAPTCRGGARSTAPGTTA